MSKSSRSIPLYFITGFLGSGKTTLLNRVLGEAAAKGMRLGVIINEWGQVSIDSGLVPVSSPDEIVIEELNDGQVFCSCLTSDFIRALQLFAEKNLDAVIVETSGMANPFPLKKLLVDLNQKTEDIYQYKWMTALVDPESFLELFGVINAVEEQIIASQKIIINKIDICSQEQITETRQKIESINPGVEIIETVQADCGDFFAKPHCSLSKMGTVQQRAEVAEYPRPGNIVLASFQKFDINAIKDFMLEILPYALRVKGIIRDKNKLWHYIDGVNNRVEERELPPRKGSESTIVIIPEGGKDIQELVKNAWSDKVGGDFSINSQSANSAC